MPSARRWARRWTSCSGKTEPRPCLKVFCPAFLQKSGRGPGAVPPVARRSARNAPCAKEAQEGRPRKSNENAAHSGGVFTISRIVTRARKIPRHAARSAGTRRGRRPRRPFPSSTASPTAARRGCGRLRPPAKGEPPARVPPLTPSCASLSMGEFRALRRASKGSAPGPRPLFCKKAGQKTFKRQSTSDPNPSPRRRVIQSVREADTLAAEWQLPREWERRVGPETSRGRHHPKSAFLWGSTPFLWARPKKWGGNSSTNLKSSRTNRRVPPTQKPTQKPPASSRSPGAVIRCFFSRPSLSSRGCRAPCPTGYRSARRTGAASQGLSCCPL